MYLAGVSDPKALLGAGLAAVLPVVLRWLNPKDASFGVGEDLADISGVNICVKYLTDFQYKNKDIIPICELSYNAFFIYFAHQMKQKISKRALKTELIINPHPPDKYRTNIPLSRNNIFRAINNIKKKDKMFWKNTNKIYEN